MKREGLATPTAATALGEGGSYPTTEVVTIQYHPVS